MRHWKALSTSFATLCARLSAVGSTMIINGIAARRMTHEQFGFWSILLSLMYLSAGLDLGFRFTLGNRLAALGSRGADGEEERRETFISILFLQTLIAASGILLVLLLFPLIPWDRWFQITDPRLIAQARLLMPVVMVLMLGCLPFALMWTVFFAYQEIKFASFLGGLMNVLLTIVFILSAYRLKFTWIIVAYFGSNLVLGVIVTAYVFVHRGWRLTLLPPARIFAIAGSMATVSFHSFFFNLSSVIAMILGPIFSGAVSGLAAAGDFTLIQKLFSFLTSAHLALLAPVGPAVTLESHSGNWDAVRRRLRVCVFQVWPAMFAVLGGVIWYAHPVLIHLWAGKWLRLDSLATILFAWACLNGFVNTFTVFLNSLGLMKMQAAVAFTMLFPSLLLPGLLSRWFGVQGVALSMVICLLPAVIIWPIYTRRALRLHLIRV